MPCCRTFAPQASMPAVRAFWSIDDVVRVSWPVSMVFAFIWVARTWPTWRASWGVMVVSVLPLMPLVPKSFVKGSLLFWCLWLWFIVFVWLCVLYVVSRPFYLAPDVLLM